MRSVNRFAATLALALSVAFTADFVRAAPEVKPAATAKTDARKLTDALPARLGDALVATSAARSGSRPAADSVQTRFSITGEARRSYRAADGNTYSVEVTRTRTPAAAYALLTVTAEQLRREPRALEPVGDLGTYGFAAAGQVIFTRGADFVRVSPAEVSSDAANSDAGFDLPGVARAFDATLAGVSDETEIPVLVKHLPDWQQTQSRATYAVTLEGLRGLIGGHPVFDGYDFSGGTEAVVAPFTLPNGGGARLALVEHLTPQLAADNDRLVTARIAESRAQGAAAPAYKRVGNYLVFAFDAPDEASGNELIGRVKYEQDVRWIGDDSYARERAERAYTMMSLNVIMASLKSAGLGILLCLGVGITLGSVIFLRRRAQSTAAATYTDAGGMVRLGIDDLTPHKEPARLIASGDNS